MNCTHAPRILLLAFAALLGILPLLTSCQDAFPERPNTSVFRYNESASISSLDPAFARNPQNIWPTNQLFNGLVQLDDSLMIQPDLAHSWEYNDSSRVYRFFLRDDVSFHENPAFAPQKTRKVTAHDFVYSFDRLNDPKIASPGSWVLHQVADYYAESDLVFVVQLKQSFPPFLGILSMRYCSVVPHEAITYYGKDFRKNPVGTGPFHFKLWIENTKLVLRKNPFYFEKDSTGVSLPYLEAVAITFLPDKQSEFLEFSQGNLDFISGIDQSYKDELLTSSGALRAKYKESTYMLSIPFLNTEYIGFYLPNDQLEVQSIKLRRAANYGIDRKKMITYLRNGIGIPGTYGFIPHGMPGAVDHELYPYDFKKSQALVQEFIKEHNKAPKLTISTNSQYLDICEYIQTELEKVGIEVAIDVMPPATLRQLKNTGGLELFRGSWVADYPDAENYLSLFISDNFTPNGPNYTHFKDPVIDSLYTAALQSSDLKSRLKIYQAMDARIMEQAPVIPLYYDMAVRFVHQEVQGLGINPQNFLFLKHVKKTAKSQTKENE
jgi:ABC-type transport system substrate-binding protein